MAEAMIDAGEYQVLLERRGRTRYALESVAAWVMGIVTLDPSAGELATKRFEAMVRSKADGKTVWRERLSGEGALAEAEELADQVRRMDIQDFILKKEHGWRLD